MTTKGARQTNLQGGYSKTNEPVKRNKTTCNLPDVRTLLFASPRDEPELKPQSRAQSQHRQNPDALEKQLDSELQADPKVLVFPRRLRKAGTTRQLVICPVRETDTRAEQDTFEELNQWERGKIGTSKEELDYGAKVRLQLEKYAEDSAEQMLKEDWAKNDPVIRGPAQQMSGIMQLGTLKLMKLYSRRATNGGSSTSLPVLNPKGNSSSSKLYTLQLAKVHQYSSPVSPGRGIFRNDATAANRSTDNLKREDKRILYQLEINMQLVSLCLQQLLEKKRKKQDTLRLQNSKLMQQILDKDNTLQRQTVASRVPSHVAKPLAAVQMGKCKRETEVSQLKKEVSEMRALVQENTTKIRKVETKVKALRKELRDVKKEQLDYYHELLQDGTEYRQEGMIWIIKTIWYLGGNVTLSKLPRFLDEKANEFLFKHAKIDIKCAEIQKELKVLITKRKSERLKQMTVRKSDAWRGVAIGILMKVLKIKFPNSKDSKTGHKTPANAKPITALTVPKETEKTTWTTFSKFFQKSYLEKIIGPKEDEKLRSELDEGIDRLQTELGQLRAELREMKQAEVARITREFAVAGYAQKYGSSLKHVICALVGEGGVYYEGSKLSRGKEAYLMTTQKNSTFHFGGRPLMSIINQLIL